MTQRATTPCITGAALSPATRSHNPVGEPNPTESSISPDFASRRLEVAGTTVFDKTTVRSALAS